MNITFSIRKHNLLLVLALAIFACGNIFQVGAEEEKKTEKKNTIQQYERISNKIKAGSSSLSIDLPFVLEAPLVDEEISEDLKGWIVASKRCQVGLEKLTVACTYAKFTPNYINSYISGHEKESMNEYLKGSMVAWLEKLEEDKLIKSLSYRSMDIKLTGNKDTALLLKGTYREKSENFEVWVLQILHKREIWQLSFFFDPKDLAMLDAVEAACFSATAK